MGQYEPTESLMTSRNERIKTMSTTKELLQTLNVLRLRAGKTELSAWKQSREKLESAIADLTDELGDVEADEVVDRSEPETAQTEVQTVETEAVEQEPAASDLTDVEGQTETTDLTSDGTAPQVEKSPRGAIGALVIELLVTDMPYEDIVARVRSTYPDARTTARSIASVAMDLRRDGVDVPSRRKPAKAKPAKAEAPSEG